MFPQRTALRKLKRLVDIRSVAVQEGMDTLYIDGIDKVMRGVTTLEEVYRVAKRTDKDTVVVDA